MLIVPHDELHPSEDMRSFTKSIIFQQQNSHGSNVNAAIHRAKRISSLSKLMASANFSTKRRLKVSSSLIADCFKPAIRTFIDFGSWMSKAPWRRIYVQNQIPDPLEILQESNFPSP